MPVYTQVAYDLTSEHGTVSQCLRKKRDIATPGSADKISGIGSASCCSAVSALVNNEPQLIIGNSRNKVPYKRTAIACVHGECNALWDAIEEQANGMPTILEMYIEMHPCPKCAAFLDNALPPGQEVLYSFPYSPAGVTAWTAAAKALCS